MHKRNLCRYICTKPKPTQKCRELLLRTVKALRPCPITTGGVEGGLQRQRAQDAVLSLVFGIREGDRERLRHGAVLDPRAHLVEDSGRLPACAAGAVLEPGDLEDAEEVVDVWEHLGDGLIVVACALGRDVRVGLKQGKLAFCTRGPFFFSSFSAG